MRPGAVDFDQGSPPWRDSSNEQRLDGENGLLLTPTVDHLFDKSSSLSRTPSVSREA
jgi:hypothetical protein